MKEAKAELQGKYSCKLKNEFGVFSSEANVTINCVPKIRKTLIDTEVDEGKTLLLEVEIYAVPEPELVW